MRPANFQVYALFDALLLQAVKETLHAHVGAFFRREIDKADLVFHHRAARFASARGERADHQKSESGIPRRTHLQDAYVRG